MKETGNKITCLTAYDYNFAKVFNDAKVDIILVGDSLGMVIQGSKNTLKVSVDDMTYHTKIVSKACSYSYLIADMPYLSYEDEITSLKNARELINSGAKMVKLEGADNLNIFKKLIDNNIEVCGHLGLQPQSVEKLGGFKVQGKDKESGGKILKDAIKLQEIGVKLLVLECIPKSLATKISQTLKIPTIGIGAGSKCDGQVLVSYDILGLGNPPKFSKNFLSATNSIKQATLNFIKEVKNGDFPTEKHSF